MILIVTNKEDIHPTPVVEYLNERAYPVFRLNTEMNGFLLYRIGGNIFSQFSVILVMYLILTCVLFPLLYVLYRNS